MNYFLTYTVYVLILSLLMGISTWKLYKKMGYNPLFAFVPFYNYYIIQKETGHPKWKTVDLTALPPGWQVGVCVKAGMALDYKPACKPGVGNVSDGAANDSNEEYLNLLKQRLQQ